MDWVSTAGSIPTPVRTEKPRTRSFLRAGLFQGAPVAIIPAMSLSARVAIYFDEDGYVESPDRTVGKGQGGGPMGRHVAGKEFLNAYMRMSQSQEFYGLVRSAENGRLLVSLCHNARIDLTPRNLYVLQEKGFHDVFFRQCPVTTIHYPAPTEARFAWARQFPGTDAYALSGITHTICTIAATRAMTQFVGAPFESYDRLICISKAAVASVKAVTDAYCDFLADRYGGRPQLRMKLQNIPLGVDTEKFRPPTDEEKVAARSRFKVAPDEVAVLYLGRLLHYGKVHPFPIFEGLSRVAKSTGKKVRLLLAGWTPTEPVKNAFQDGSRIFAPGVQVTFLDGTNSEVRQKVWWAADMFAFPTDNLQETFPQSVVEAMSSGLPVVAARWDGCKDQVIDGETGFLAPTYMLRGATAETTSKLIIGEYTYPHFMARCSQAAAVDLKAITAAFEKLIVDEPLRKRMGAAGRKRAVEEFAWEHIIRRYEEMWDEQEQERQAAVRQHQNNPPGRRIVPPCYPPPESTFAEYPTRFLEPEEVVRSTPDAQDRLDVFRTHPLTEYGKQWRCDDPKILRLAIDAAKDGITFIELRKQFTQNRIGATEAMAAIMWMMKYGLIELQ